MRKESLKNKKGITLIALVVTIVVLLILAGVSISMLTGENGIITQAKEAKEATRGGEIKERVQLAVTANEMAEHTNVEKKSKEDIIAELVAEGVLTEKEAEKLETEDVITIGGIEIDFGTIGNVSTSDPEETPGGEENPEEGGNTPSGGEIAKSDLIIGRKDESGEITVTNGKYTLQVGDYINYSPTDGVEATTITSYSTENGYGDQEFSSNYTGKWRVLGISEKGQIVIVPENVIKTKSNGYYLKGQSGYVNAVDELDKISAIFANGYGASGKARSVTVEDINSITGYNPQNVGKYDPEQTGSGSRYGSGNIYEYGNKVTYYWNGTDKPYYTYTKLDGTAGTPGSLSTSHSKFNWLDSSTKEWKTSEKATLEETVTDGDTTKMKEITTLESDYYNYYLNSLTDTDAAGEGLTSGTKAYTTLYNGGVQDYWLGSTYVNTGSFYTSFGVLFVYDGFVKGSGLRYSDGNDEILGRYVRPAVYLNSDIQLTGNSTDGWTIVKN